MTAASPGGRAALALGLLLASGSATGDPPGRVDAAPPVRLTVLEQGSLEGWRSRSFEGETRYRTESVDGQRAVRAESLGTASGWYLELPVDLERTPYLNWRWRVADLADGADERRRGGDDFALRVYVVFSGGLAFWKTRSLSYVWSAAEPVGSDWPSPYTGRAWMFALRSGTAELGQWRQEKRDIRADFRHAFGGDVGQVDAIAIMTDTDDAGGRALGWYGDIWFSAH